MNIPVSRIGPLLLLLVVATSAWCQDESRRVTGLIDGEEVVGPMPGIKATVVLTDERLRLLRQSGALQISVPSSVGNVQAVVLRRPLYFKEESAKGYGNSVMQQKMMVVDVGEKILDRIDYQPVELKVYEEGFSSIVLKYAGGISSAVKDTEQLGDPQVDSPVVTLRLKNGRGIMGRMRGLKTISIESDIGKLELEVANIRRMEANKNGKLTIEMPSGNRISGNISTPAIELLSRWEDETFKISEIDQIVIEKPAVANALPSNRNTGNPTTIAR